MAITSIYKKFVDENLGAIAMGVATKYNGKDYQPTYLHKALLKKRQSFNGRWDSVSKNVGFVMADYVTTNTGVPLKSRDSMELAGGKIHKIGVGYYLDEDQIQTLSFIRNQRNTSEEDIASLIFGDVPRVISGVNERLEDTFLVGASNGYCIVDSDNVGIGVRMNYGYKSENLLGVTTLWSSTSTAKPLDDLDRAQKKNKRNRFWMMDKVALNAIFMNAEARQYFGFISGWMGDVSAIPNLNQDTAIRVLKDKFKIDDILIVDRETVYEIDGVRTAKTPWKEGTIAMFPSRDIGILAWSKLAEAEDGDKMVSYATVDEYLLISQWRDSHPFLTEHTKAQGLVVPVIENGNQVVTLDTLTVQV